MKITTRPIGDLHPHPDNARRGDVPALAESLETNGQYRPIVIDQNDTILAGHHLVEAAKTLGWDSIDTVQVTVDQATARRIMLADNRISELGGYDPDRLADLERLLSEQAGEEWTPPTPEPDRPKPTPPTPPEQPSAGAREGQSQYDQREAWEQSESKFIVLELNTDTHPWIQSALRELDGDPEHIIARLVANACNATAPDWE